MAMGTRRKRQRQQDLFYTAELAEAPGHPFYTKLNEALDAAGFDAFCEERCQRLYHEKLGPPSLTPGAYFRLQLIGFFEGVGSERGIACRVADSLSLRRFLGYGLDEATPNHVTLSRTRRAEGGRQVTTARKSLQLSRGSTTLLLAGWRNAETLATPPPGIA